MIFAEKQLTTETEGVCDWEYWTEDVFGELTITSSVKLDKKKLDGITMLVLKQSPGAETVTGEVKHDEGVVSYKLIRRPQWEDDDEEETEDESCTNTPTSIRERVSAIIATALSTIPGLSWCKRFVVAFREAWKRMR